MKRLAEEIGREKFVRMLQTASEAATSEEVSKIPVPLEKRDLAMCMEGMKNHAPIFDKNLVYEIVKDNTNEFEVRVTECRWAKIFRQGAAGDIGYASVCHTDFAAARAFNPRLEMKRSRTLMQGDECCDSRWVMTP